MDRREVPVRRYLDGPACWRRRRPFHDCEIQSVPRAGDGLYGKGALEARPGEGENEDLTAAMDPQATARKATLSIVAAERVEKGTQLPGLRAEERAETGRGLVLADLLLLLLLLLFLLFLLLARGGRGSGGGCHRSRRCEDLIDVHALEGGGQRLHAGLIDLHTGRREDLL